MENYTLMRIDWAEYFPGATAKVLQAIDEDGDLLAEIKVSSDVFWDLPGDEFDEDDLDEDLLEKLMEDYSQRQGD